MASKASESGRPRRSVCHFLPRGLLSAAGGVTNGTVITLKNPVVTGARAYLLAAVCVGLALLLRLALDSLWQDRLAYAWFFIAVFVVAQFAENGPTAFAIVAGFLLANWFFVAPRHSFLVGGAVDQVNAFCYFIICVVVLLFSLRARQALARERTARVAVARLAAIIESSDDAIIGKSADGNIISWNSAAFRLYGYTEGEMLGKPITLLVPPDREAELAPLMERVLRGEPINHFETTRLTKNGSVVEVSLSISPVRDDTGKIVGASTIARDISQRARAERERERLMGELQKALAEVKTLGGLLPICAYCKKIRDDKGYWNQIELFIRERSNANFTHSVCPECARQHYPDLFPDASS